MLLLNHGSKPNIGVRTSAAASLAVAAARSAGVSAWNIAHGTWPVGFQQATYNPKGISTRPFQSNRDSEKGRNSVI
jgi:hypothetical protein